MIRSSSLTTSSSSACDSGLDSCGLVNSANSGLIVWAPPARSSAVGSLAVMEASNLSISALPPPALAGVPTDAPQPLASRSPTATSTPVVGSCGGTSTMALACHRRNDAHTANVWCGSTVCSQRNTLPMRCSQRREHSPAQTSPEQLPPADPSSACNRSRKGLRGRDMPTVEQMV